MLKKFIFWDFPRGSWQYDVVVALILAFIFLTPRGWFRDQPRVPAAVMLPAGDYWLEPGLLADVPEAERVERATAVLANQFNKKPVITRVEPITDSESEITGYLAVSAH
jgi:hypothetical protein